MENEINLKQTQQNFRVKYQKHLTQSPTQDVILTCYRFLLQFNTFFYKDALQLKPELNNLVI